MPTERQCEAMRDVKYYPVIDCDSEGTEKKVALFPVYNRDTVSANHNVWLEEMIPHHFRLCTKNTKEPRTKGAFTLHCPACNSSLRLIGEATDNKKIGAVCMQFLQQKLRRHLP